MAYTPDIATDERDSIGELIGSSFALVHRYRYLWFLGVVPGMGAGLPFWPLPTTADLPHTVRGIAFTTTDWVLGGIVGTIVLVVWGILSIGALVRNVQAIDDDQIHGLGSGLGEARRCFGRLFGVYLRTGVVAAVILILPAVAHWLAWMIADVAGRWFWVVSVPIAVAAVLGWRFWSAFSVRFLLLEPDCDGAAAATWRGWRLLRSEPGPTIVAGLAQLAIVAGVACAAGIVGIGLTIPGRILNQYNWMAGVAFAVFVLIPYTLLIGGWVGSFSVVFWTRLFRQLQPRPAPRPEDELPGGALPATGAPSPASLSSTA